MALSIALAGPFSGSRSEYGVMIRSVAENYRGKLDLHFYDDEADYRKVRKLASKIVCNEHDVVVGHFNSQCALAASKVYVEHSIPLLLPASTADSISHLDLAFRYCAKDSDLLSEIHRKVISDPTTEYRIWEDGTDYGRHLKDILLSNSNEHIYEFNVEKDKDVRVICLGSQSNISNFILSHGNRYGYLVSDDCDIDVFYTRCCHIEDVLIARSSHGYLDLLTQVLDFLVICESKLIKGKFELVELMKQSKSFDENGDSKLIEFGIYKANLCIK